MMQARIPTNLHNYSTDKILCVFQDVIKFFVKEMIEVTKIFLNLFECELTATGWPYGLDCLESFFFRFDCFKENSW